MAENKQRHTPHSPPKEPKKNRTCATAVALEKQEVEPLYKNYILNVKIISLCGFFFRHIRRHVIAKCVNRLSPLDSLTYAHDVRYGSAD